MKLYELTRDIEEINSLIESGDIEASDAIDTLDSMKLAVKEKGLNITALLLNEECDVEAMKMAEERIAQRRRAKQNKIEWLKGYLLDGMEANGMSRIECPDFAVTLAKCPPKVELIDGAVSLLSAKYGDRFVRTKTTVTINRKAIAEAIKTGEQVAGAVLTQSNRLKFS